jgi:hypothetical protein
MLLLRRSGGGGGASRVVELGQAGPPLQRAAEAELDGPEEPQVGGGDEGHGMADRTGTTRSADAVHVILRVHGDVVVHHVGDPLHVETPLGDVGGHQDPDVTSGEAIERAYAVLHAAIGVHGVHPDPFTLETGLEGVGSGLGPREDEDLIPPRLLQEVGEEVGLPLGLHRVDRLGNPGGGGPLGGGLHPDGLPGDPERQGVHPVRHRGGEEHGLTFPGGASEHVLDLGAEPHVEHTVRLVQDQDLQPRQVHVPPFQVVVEAPRRGCEDLESLGQRIVLGSVAHPADDVGGAKGGSPGQVGRILRHLLRQFPGGAENEDLESLPGLHLLERGDHEGARLPRTRLGDPDDVLPLESRRDGPGLDGRGGGPPFAFDGGESGLGKPQFTKCARVLQTGSLLACGTSWILARAGGRGDPRLSSRTIN